MQRGVLIAALAATILAGADDPWAKVIALKSGTELRITRRETAQPILARMDEANEERIVVVVRNEQTAIPKSDIERIDYRPPQTSSRVRTETTTSPGPVPGSRQELPMPKSGSPSGGSTSSGLTVTSKPGFELLYRRSSGRPKPEAEPTRP